MQLLQIQLVKIQLIEIHRLKNIFSGALPLLRNIPDESLS